MEIKIPELNITGEPGDIPAFLKPIKAAFSSSGFSNDIAAFLAVFLSFAVVLILAFAANFIAKKFIVKTVDWIASQSKKKFSSYLVKQRVFHKLSHLAPAIVIQLAVSIILKDYTPGFAFLITQLIYIYMSFVIIIVIIALIDALHDIYLTLPEASHRPINGYILLIKTILIMMGAIILIAILLRKNPVNIIVGFGASAAILMFVFRDPIMGLVASVQLSANNMAQPGDWISMPERGANGLVIDISLNNVKVQNWDNTISMIPTYALVSESFYNWKGMLQSEGRRIMRSIFIDKKTIKFCTGEMIERFKKIHLLSEYIYQADKEIKQYNLERHIDETYLINGRHLTNIGVFRKYVELYLQNNPELNQNLACFVRQLQPTERGIPLEIYCFTLNKEWITHEKIQADIFDHIFAVVDHFELKVFQNPSGDDIQKLVENFQD